MVGGGDFADGLDRDLNNVDPENEQKNLSTLKMNRKKLVNPEYDMKKRQV